MSANNEPASPCLVFVSHDAEDRVLTTRLLKALQPMVAEGMITVWDRGALVAGSDREQVIREKLDSSGLILLLVSPNFLASDDCRSDYARAMEHHRTGRTCVIPVYLQPYDLQDPIITNIRRI